MPIMAEKVQPFARYVELNVGINAKGHCARNDAQQHQITRTHMDDGFHAQGFGEHNPPLELPTAIQSHIFRPYAQDKPLWQRFWSAA